MTKPTLDPALDAYPVCILEDRYGGVYSGGQWLAIACADFDNDGDYKGGMPRILHCVEAGPHGSDPDAMAFWASPPGWIAVGETPNAALRNLYAKLGVDANLDINDWEPSK